MRTIATIVLAACLLGARTSEAQSTCDTSCNQIASECLKKCTGDSKDAARPESAQRLINCLKDCDAKVKPCRDACVAPVPAVTPKKE